VRQHWLLRKLSVASANCALSLARMSGDDAPALKRKRMMTIQVEFKVGSMHIVKIKIPHLPT
jgi:hypothetical protein